MRRLAREEMSLAETGSLEDCLAAVNYLESAGDVIASNLVTQGLRRLEHNLTISTPTQEVLRVLHRFVADALQTAVKTVRERDSFLARRVVAGKDEFNKLAQSALEQLRRRLLADEPARALTFQMEVDLVAQYQRLHHLARRLAKLVVPVPDQ
jgi:phosphate:Na+ symporter